MIDTHCHLTYTPLASQLDAVLFRAQSAGVERMLTIGTSLADARLAVEMTRSHPQVRCAIGIHPHHAAEAAADDVSALRTLAVEPTVLALGEMGLDYHYDFSPRPRQQEIFSQQLALADELGRPIVIHCREAMHDGLAMLKSYPKLHAVFHCFTGTLDEARRILDRGHLLGFTGVITFKKSEDLREVVRFTPMDRLLLETDAPYLAPEPHRRQKVNEPSLVRYTAEAIAALKGVSLPVLEEATTANAVRFFRWDH